MNTKEIEFRDPIIEKVVDKFVERSNVGFKKYGVTLQDDSGDMDTWLNHLQEELMDAVNYIERAREEIRRKPIDLMDDDIIWFRRSELEAARNFEVTDPIVVEPPYFWGYDNYQPPFRACNCTLGVNGKCCQDG